MKKKVLVTGGCGYIGSHTIVDLINNGFEVISADNFSNSDVSVLKGIQKITGQSVKNYNTDLCDLKATQKIFKTHPDIVRRAQSGGRVGRTTFALL
jgi:UDP-glucose 4-epimerase